MCHELDYSVSCHQVSDYTSLTEKICMTVLEVIGSGAHETDEVRISSVSTGFKSLIFQFTKEEIFKRHWSESKRRKQKKGKHSR